MNIKPAKGEKGFILYNPIKKEYFFRVYDKDKNFTDYKLCAEEIEVEIVSDRLEFYEDENKLDWSRKVLGKNE